jgi:hypothetical protein
LHKAAFALLNAFSITAAVAMGLPLSESFSGRMTLPSLLQTSLEFDHSHEGLKLLKGTVSRDF